MATLFEVFRVGNVLPGPLPRMATEPFIINGINVSVVKSSLISILLVLF